MRTVNIRDLEWITPQEMATSLRVNKETIYRLIKDGKIQVLHVGTNFRISQESYQKFLKENCK